MQGRLRRTVLGGNQKEFLGCNATAYSHYACENSAPETILIDFGISLLSRKLVQRGFHALLPDARDHFYKKNDPAHTPSRPASALFITHGHNDHIGAVVHYLNMGYVIPPIYATPLSRTLIEDELRHFGIPEADWPPFQDIKADDKISCGPYEVEPFAVSHSLPFSFGFAVRAGGETFIESGDLKAAADIFLGPATDFQRLRDLAKENIGALFLDGTKALSAQPNETNAGMLTAFNGLLEKHPHQRMIVSFYGGYVESMALMLVAAAEHGRTAVIGAGSVRRFFNALESSGFDITAAIQSHTGKLLRIVDGFDPAALKLLPEETLVLTGGSDADQYGSVIKAVEGKNPWLQLNNLDVLFLNAFTLPGQEAFFDALCKKIRDRGLTLYTRDDIYIHGNGHASLPELLQISRAMSPRLVVPTYCMDIMADSLVTALANENQPTIRQRDGDSLDFTENAANPVLREQDHEKLIGVRFDSAQKKVIYTLDIDRDDGKTPETLIKEFNPHKDKNLSRRPFVKLPVPA